MKQILLGWVQFFEMKRKNKEILARGLFDSVINCGKFKEMLLMLMDHLASIKSYCKDMDFFYLLLKIVYR